MIKTVIQNPDKNQVFFVTQITEHLTEVHRYLHYTSNHTPP
jgi:hypothetical protein